MAKIQDTSIPKLDGEKLLASMREWPLQAQDDSFTGRSGISQRDHGHHQAVHA